ncbi:MAG: hypothetical protein U0I22_01750, partial [Treponema sp.]|nr:hypothetical protein [Treponema sp.]
MAHRKDFHSSKFAKKNQTFSKKEAGFSHTIEGIKFQEQVFTIPASLPTGSVGYLAFPNQAEFLLSELENRFHLTKELLEKAHRYENLFIFEPHHLPDNFRDSQNVPQPYWCSTILLEPQIIN